MPGVGRRKSARGLAHSKTLARGGEAFGVRQSPAALDAGCGTNEKRQRTGALQDAGARWRSFWSAAVLCRLGCRVWGEEKAPGDWRTPRRWREVAKLLECGSPLPLWM